jgi:hypothetical protein
MLGGRRQGTGLEALSVRYSYPLAFVSTLTAQLGLEEATRVSPTSLEGPTVWGAIRYEI